MSAEQRSESTAAHDEQRAALPCGRSLPPLHLAELDEVFSQRHHHRDPIVLCGAEVTDPNPADGDRDCLGCGDCLRYCPECVRAVTEVVRWMAGDDLLTGRVP
ncbi:MAG: hypothetical protein M3R63_07830, partial [Actinomycetota bacterium]|nr:hypothetical protein [Actinomycetota bacterium]